MAVKISTEFRDLPVSGNVFGWLCSG
jgi:hypothetical protein